MKIEMPLFQILTMQNNEELAYFHLYDLYDIDVISNQTHESYHQIELYAFNRDSEPCLIRTKYCPYAYLELPDSYNNKPIIWKKSLINTLLRELNTPFRNFKPKLVDDEIFSIEKEKCRPLHGYLDGEKTYLKIKFLTKSAMYATKDRIERSQVFLNGMRLNLTLHETNVDSMRKFTVERQLNYADWFKINKNHLKEITDEEEKISTFAHEYVVDWDLIFPEKDKEVTRAWRVHPRIAGYDIEARSDNKMVFPSAFKPSNIAFMVSVNFQVLGKPETKKRICIVYGDGVAPDDAIVHYTNSEKEMIDKFVEIINQYNVDFLVGHHNFGFDDMYLHQRYLNLWAEWPQCGSRIKNRKPTFSDASWSSSGTNKVDLKTIDFPGRVTFDTRNITKQMLVKLPNYTLNAVAEYYLKRKKRDIGHEELFAIIDNYIKLRKRMEHAIASTDPDGKMHPHDNISDEVWQSLLLDYEKSLKDMGRLIDYCSEDSALVVDLFEKLNVWINVAQASNIIQVCPKYVYTKGQQFKGVSQIYSLIKEKNDKDKNGVIFNASHVEVNPNKYEGAINLGMKYGRVGFFSNVPSVDINSMYPSIVLANNLCVSTERTKEQIEKYQKNQYNNHEWTESTTGDHYDLYFVTKDIHFGFFPRLVNRLLSERGAVKKILGTLVEGSFDYLMYDAIQNALKISANSIYGMLGTSKNPKVPAKHIAALVTKIGRETIISIAKFVEHGGDPTKPPTLPPGEIVYGDTDSCQFQIKLDTTDVNEIIKWSLKYVEAINAYISPLRIVLEKFGDIMVVTPKKYIFHFRDLALKNRDGTPNTNYGNYALKDAYKYTGVDVVKRNQPQVLKRLFYAVTNGIMSESLFSEIEDPMQREIKRLEHIIDTVFQEMYKIKYLKYPLSDYVSYEGYNSENGKLSTLAARMSEIGKPIQIGERVAYVVVTYPGKTTRSKKAESYRCIDSIGEDERIDVQHYIKAMIKPIDGLIRARYQGNGSNIYNNFFDAKKVVAHILSEITKRGDVDINLRDQTSNGLNNFMIRHIKHNMENGKIPRIVSLPDSFTQLMEDRETEKYQARDRQEKAAITRQITNIKKSTGGLILAINRPTIIENILYADDIAMLDAYAGIMMSKQEYKNLCQSLQV